MKNLDLFSKRVLVIAISICAVLLSATLLIKTATPAVANAVPNFAPAQSSSDKTYDAILIPFPGNNPPSTVFIWNTKTGTYLFTSPSSSYRNSGDNFENRNW